MLSITKIFELLDKFDHANGSSASNARLEANNLLRREQFRAADSTGAQIELLSALANYQMNSVLEDPWHPAMTEAPSSSAPARPRGRLTAEEQRWLSALPSTPRNLGRASMCKLLALLVAMRDDPLAASDLPLVESMWAPVERYCNLKYAQDELAQAQMADMPSWPRALTQAVADVLLLEGTTTDPGEALSQAEDRITEYKQTRAQRRAHRAAQARRNLDELSRVSA